MFFQTIGLESGEPGTAPGAALVVRTGEQISIEVAGLSDLETQAPITSESAFHVGSIAKQFTALLIARLIGRGQLSLDTETGVILQWVPDPLKRCRVRHLLFHTSGIRDQWALAYFAGLRTGDQILTSDVRQWTKHETALNFESGTKFLYCNTGYTLLALLVEELHRGAFVKVAHDEIFVPLGMSATQFVTDPNDIIYGRVRGYRRSENMFKCADPPYGVIGSTCLRTTPNDMQRWIEADLQSDYFEPARAGGYFEQGFTDDGRPMRYGFGQIHSTIAGQSVLFHGGFDYGFNAVIARCPAEKVGLFACGSGGYAMLEKAGMDLFTELLDKKTTQTHISTPTVEPRSSASLEPGVYATHDFSDVRAIVRTKEGRLRLEWKQGFDITQRSDGAFELAGTTIILRAAGDGNLTFSSDSGSVHLRRISREAVMDDMLIGDYFCEELQSLMRIQLTANGPTIQIGRNDATSLDVVARQLIRWDCYWATLETAETQIIHVRASHPRCLNVRYSRVPQTTAQPKPGRLCM